MDTRSYWRTYIYSPRGIRARRPIGRSRHRDLYNRIATLQYVPRRQQWSSSCLGVRKPLFSRAVEEELSRPFCSVLIRVYIYIYEYPPTRFLAKETKARAKKY